MRLINELCSGGDSQPDLLEKAIGLVRGQRKCSAKLLVDALNVSTIQAGQLLQKLEQQQVIVRRGKGYRVLLPEPADAPLETPASIENPPDVVQASAGAVVESGEPGSVALPSSTRPNPIRLNDPTQPHQICNLAISQITADSSIQCRRKMDPDRIAAYAQLLGDGSTPPLLDVFFDGETYWLVDGFHRLAAAQQAGQTTVACRVFEGTYGQAHMAAANTNFYDGVERTIEDKHNAVDRVLSTHGQWSNRQIAQWCGVSDHLVAKRREQTGSETGDAQRVYTRKGKEQVMRVREKNGKTPPPADSYDILPALPPAAHGLSDRLDLSNRFQSMLADCVAHLDSVTSEEMDCFQQISGLLLSLRSRRGEVGE